MLQAFYHYIIFNRMIFKSRKSIVKKKKNYNSSAIIKKYLYPASKIISIKRIIFSNTIRTFRLYDCTATEDEVKSTEYVCVLRCVRIKQLVLYFRPCIYAIRYLADRNVCGKSVSENNVFSLALVPFLVNTFGDGRDYHLNRVILYIVQRPVRYYSATTKRKK